MENFIKYVHINNFKSIADLKLEDCRRINLFLGYPNVGKSNALEALSLFSVPYLKGGESLKKLVRFENRNELFNNISQQQSEIETNQGSITLVNNGEALLISVGNAVGGYSFALIDNLMPTHNIREANIKRYIFRINNIWKSNGGNRLLPPFGENIVDTLSFNYNNISEVNSWIEREFAKYNLEYVLDFNSHSVKIQKRLSENKVRQLPYSSIADTLQRLIFYKTAIASNKNSVLLFEEPEAHAFPPYIQTIMQDIIDAETNQFFIVTHSPLVVNAFLEYEKLRKETSIYLFDFKDNQTVAKRLSDEEMELAYEYGDDLFFNLENFL